MAVGQHIGDRETGQTAGSGRLNNPHIGDIVGCQLVKFQLQIVHIAGRIVGL